MGKIIWIIDPCYGFWIINRVTGHINLLSGEMDLHSGQRESTFPIAAWR